MKNDPVAWNIGAPQGFRLTRSKAAGTVGDYDYLVTSAAELAALMTTPGVATLSGKTIAMAPGDYAWADATWANRAFTSETIFTSQNPDNKARIVAAGNFNWAAPTNVTLDGLRIWAPFTPGTHNAAGSCITLTGTVSGLKIQNCDLAGNLLELVQADGYPDNMTDWTWRGLLGFDGTTAVGAGGMRLIDNTIRGSWRLLNLPHAVAGPQELIGNELYDFGVDAAVFSRGRVGMKFNWNTIRAPLSGWNGVDIAGTFDPATDRFTSTAPHGLTGTVTMNISPNTTTLPGGLTYSADYAVTVVDATTLQWPVDVTSAGSGVRVYREPAHADFLQGIPGGEDSWDGFEIIGNVFIAKRADAIESYDDAQVLFIEDINNLNDNAHHYQNGLIAGNVIWSNSNHGISIYNAINCDILFNTMAGPVDVAGRVPVVIGQHFPSGTGSGNRVLNNITTATSSDFGDRLRGNVLVGPGSASYLAQIAGPVTPPTTRTEILSRLATLAGSTAARQEPKAGAVGTGYFDHAARTYSLPALPAYDLHSLTVTPQTGTTMLIDVSTTSGTGTLYWMASTTAKTAAEVITQGAAAAKGTQAVSGTGAQAQITASGLTAETAYQVYVVQVNGSAQQSQMLYAAATTPVAASFARVANAAPARVTKTGGFASATTAKTGTFAWKGKLTGGDATFRKLLMSAGFFMDIGFRSSNAFRLTMYGTDNAVKLQLDSTGVTFNVALGEILLLASWDTAAARSELYVNGVSRIVRTTVLDALQNFTSTSNIGGLAEYAGASPCPCQTDYMLFDNAFVDLAVAGNRTPFDTASGLGVNGSGATGQQPLVYLTGNAAAWNGNTQNLGRGGAFGHTGTFTDV